MKFQISQKITPDLSAYFRSSSLNALQLITTVTAQGADMQLDEVTISQ